MLLHSSTIMDSRNIDRYFESLKLPVTEEKVDTDEMLIIELMRSQLFLLQTTLKKMAPVPYLANLENFKFNLFRLCDTLTFLSHRQILFFILWMSGI